MNWIGCTPHEMLAGLAQGQVSAVDLTEQHLAHITRTDTRVGAFLEVFGESALKAAAEIDQRRQQGEAVGPLAGLPIALKDNMCLTGEISSCASRMLAKFRSPYDSHVVQKLKAAGAVILGRTNMDEFAMGSSCESSAWKTTQNPWSLIHTPGGSSGGSAAAVAAGQVPFALGSDTGGSIRQPAAFCGIVGMKPTYGRVSRYGLVAFASSLDQIGPFATDVSGTALALEAIAGHDPRDSTSANVPVGGYTATVETPFNGLRIGIVPQHYGEGLHPEVRQAVRQAIDRYRHLGAEIVEIELPHADYGVAVYYVLAPSEASSNLSRFDGIHYGHRAEKFDNLASLYERSRGEGFGDEVKRRIMLGTYALSSGYYDAYYKKALQVRRLIRDDFTKAFASVDLILTPASPTPPFKVGELSHDPLALYLNDLFTIGANLAGLPGISLPCGKTVGGLPIGVQLLAPAFEEERLLRAARMLEKDLAWEAERRNCVQRLAS